MEKLSKRDALLDCFDLWVWLSVTGSKRKVGWPEWKSNGGSVKWCATNCPVCQYSYEHDTRCNQCLIGWTTGPGNHCTDSSSPYHKWAIAKTIARRKEYALEIAVLALKALPEED